jgi:hypothetical protein
MSIFKLVSDSDTRFKNICLELLVVGFSIIGILDSSTERRVIGRALARPITTKSPVFIGWIFWL